MWISTEVFNLLDIDNTSLWVSDVSGRQYGTKLPNSKTNQLQIDYWNLN